MEMDELLEAYVATWNETDPLERRSRIETYWHEDAWYANAVQDYEGHDGIATAMQRNFDKWVSNGYRFRSAGTTSAHHDTARFAWQMIDPAGREVVSRGTNFIRVTDGQVSLDAQFTDA
jgi:SnoaL-like domain